MAVTSELFLDPFGSGDARRDYKDTVEDRVLDKTHLQDSTDPFYGDGEWVPGIDHTRSLEILERRHRWVLKLGADRVLSWDTGDLARFASEGCGTWAAVGDCTDCHTKVARSIPCGREWCPTCGEVGSRVHLQRMDRWIGKMQQMRDIGYMVVEARAADRVDLMHVTELRKARRRVMHVMKDAGYLRGLGRWHTWGDPSCPTCRTAKGRPRKLLPTKDNGYRCKHCGFHAARNELMAKGAIQFNPHMNLLFDAAYIQGPQLADLRGAIRKSEPRFYLSHYQYRRLVSTAGLEGDALQRAEAENRKTVRTYYHWLRYITRSTFLEVDWAPEFADQLTEERFHTTWTWGGSERWQGPAQWGSDHDEEPEGGCPVCHGRIHWDHVEPIADVFANYGTLGGGHDLWILPAPEVPTPDDS